LQLAGELSQLVFKFVVALGRNNQPYQWMNGLISPLSNSRIDYYLS
jgi:hypothetical protein